MSEMMHVDLVTPERQFASCEASLIEVPGAMGDFGVLPGHSPLISTIRAGVISVYPNEGDKKNYLAMGGVAEVTNQRCTILAEYLENISDVTAEQANERFLNARKAVDEAITEEEKRETAKQYEIAEALHSFLI